MHSTHTHWLIVHIHIPINILCNNTQQSTHQTHSEPTLAML